MCTPTQGVWQPAGCVSCELVCVCVSLVRVVIICLASTHTALVSSPSLTVLHLPTYIHTTCLPVFVAWRLCPVCAASCTPEFILMSLARKKLEALGAPPGKRAVLVELLALSFWLPFGVGTTAVGAL